MAATIAMKATASTFVSRHVLRSVNEPLPLIKLRETTRALSEHAHPLRSVHANRTSGATR
jgi:hypothetical protein